MSHSTRPVVGEWYSCRNSCHIFEVTYVDVENGVVDIQDESGILAEMDLADWHAVEMKMIEPPRNEYDELGEVAVLSMFEAVLAVDAYSKAPETKYVLPMVEVAA